MGYVSFQGIVKAATVANGVPGPFRDVGNVPDQELKFGIETDPFEHKESRTGQRATDLRIVKEKKGSLSVLLEDFSDENLALALQGTASEVSGASVTDEASPDTLEVGQFVRLAYPKVSAVTITDSAGSPVTLVEGTHYRLSADFGHYEILDLTGLTLPFLASYTYGTFDNVNIFTGAQPEIWLRFEGVDTADDDSPVLVEFYKVALDPLSELDLIHEEMGQLPLSGSMLYDETKDNDTVLGQFGRIVRGLAA